MTTLACIHLNEIVGVLLMGIGVFLIIYGLLLDE